MKYTIINILMSLFLCVYGGIYNDTEHEWKFPIQYKIWKQVNSTFIIEALNLISNNTCLNFTRNDNLTSQEPGIIFGSRQSGCSLNTIGPKENNHSVAIYLGLECRYNKVFIASLILQALGVFPEHTRQDRNKYVDIKYGNIKDGTDLTFFNISDPKVTSDFDTNYDYGSSVQYYSKSYTKDGSDTILAVGNYSKYYQLMLGQKNVVTLNDYKLVSRRYCNKTCDESERPRCAHGGYKNPRDCSKCVCPYPYKGDICTEKIESLEKQAKCHPIQTAVSTKGNTYQYNGKGICVDTFIASEGKKVQLKILEQNMTPQTPCARNSSMVEVKYKKEDERDVMGLCFCGNRSEPVTITSEGTDVILIYNGGRNDDSLKVELKAID
uniref:Metalloendopeptidase n=1 Tax=Parastrongyloides trichosuri TaxID=131310 RepID=A0A0N4ZLP6_PARTI